MVWKMPSSSFENDEKPISFVDDNNLVGTID